MTVIKVKINRINHRKCKRRGGGGTEVMKNAERSSSKIHR